MNLFIFLWTFVGIPVLSYGAGAEGVPWFLVSSQALNFSLFIIILFFLLRKKVKNLFLQREKDYYQSFRQAEIQRDRAEKQKLDLAQKLKVLESDEQKALQKARNEAEDLKKKILAQAHLVSERLSKEVHRTIQYEFDKAFLGLKEELWAYSLDDAKLILKEKVDVSVQKKLNAEFTRKVQESVL